MMMAPCASSSAHPSNLVVCLRLPHNPANPVNEEEAREGMSVCSDFWEWVVGGPNISRGRSPAGSRPARSTPPPRRCPAVLRASLPAPRNHIHASIRSLFMPLDVTGLRLRGVAFENPPDAATDYLLMTLMTLMTNKLRHDCSAPS